MHTYLRNRRHEVTVRHVGQNTMKSSVQAILQSAHTQNKRDSFRTTRRHMSLFETMTENGDLLRPDMMSSSRKDLKLGEIDIRALQHKQQIAEMTR